MPKSANQQRLLYCFVAAACITLLGIATLGYLRSKNDRSVPVKSLDSWQVADAPLGFPLPSPSETTAPFDPRFIQLTAFERATIPTATRMAPPMGTEAAGLTYNAQPFWSLNTQRGGHHTGDDINGIGGMNTDLDDPVYAIANGLVVYRGQPSPGWGKTLILAHRTPQGQILLSMYSHLHQNNSPYGDLVHLGETIGTVGTANLNYLAHLHLEMRDSTGIYIGPGYNAHQGEWMNAAETIKSHTSSNPTHIHPSPLSIILSERLKLKNERLSIKNQSDVTK
ncbi:MAG: M23 family metallopeptidase [Verrucomicrobiae bacterium]|nr:M23 family metallopeptidase [Verrucomicrobiae bacterium]NNJ43505.1 M23 family metallopeptidase [Akkermansiaceae bacterium]